MGIDKLGIDEVGINHFLLHVQHFENSIAIVTNSELSVRSLPGTATSMLTVDCVETCPIGCYGASIFVVVLCTGDYSI